MKQLGGEEAIASGQELAAEGYWKSTGMEQAFLVVFEAIVQFLYKRRIQLPSQT